MATSVFKFISRSITCINASKNAPKLTKLGSLSSCAPDANTKPFKFIGLLSQFSSRCNLALCWHQPLQITPLPCLRLLHTTAANRDLMEFFDHKDNWGEAKVQVGRPYRMDELRLKSNSDLHKLWYVLLKERNMLMTMAEEYKRELELFPNPERLEKVEDSMENLLDVIAERDRAYHLLETGEPGEPGRRWAYNELGIGLWRKCREYPFPIHMHTRFRRSTMFSGRWQHGYLRMLRQKHLLQRRHARRMAKRKHDELKDVFPHADVSGPVAEVLKRQPPTYFGPTYELED